MYRCRDLNPKAEPSGGYETELERLNRELCLLRAENQRLRQDSNRTLAHTRGQSSVKEGIEIDAEGEHQKLQTFGFAAASSPVKQEIIEISDDENGRAPLEVKSLKSSPSPTPDSRRPPIPSTLKRDRSRSPRVPLISPPPSHQVSPHGTLRLTPTPSIPPLKVPPEFKLTARCSNPKPPKRRKTVADEQKPRIKADDSAVDLPSDVVAAYLGDAVPLAINPPLTETLYLTRKFLGNRFGGSHQEWVIKFTEAPCSGRLVLFPTSELNPYMPLHPGDPGILCSVRLEMTDGPRSVFTRTRRDGHDVWVYLGEFASEVVGKLTPQQFDAQSPQFREAWGSKIPIPKKKWLAYREMRARIALRKAGLAITDTSVAAEVRGADIPVTPDDVIQALRWGEEAISVVRMRCVSYDRAFVQVLAAARANWTPTATQRPRAKGKKASGKRKARTAPATPESEGEDDEWVPRRSLLTRRNRKQTLKRHESPAKKVEGSDWDDSLPKLTESDSDS
ncbi:hypothetical protein DFH09DRAFT_271317 [Mycena vulgaris]|nr:hypothetical protein DFH09DRAFT_271317 [Mycena vulgaris]